MDWKVSLRKIIRNDMDFLYRLYASTREEELALVDWSKEQKEAFLQMQFNAQHTYYMEQYPNAKFQIIMLDKEPIGRLYTEVWENEIRLIDIALTPKHRNKGIGSYYVKKVIDEGERADLPLRIHVERFNPALHMYKRLGFEKIGDTGVYYLMERKVGAPEKVEA